MARYTLAFNRGSSFKIMKCQDSTIIVHALDIFSSFQVIKKMFLSIKRTNKRYKPQPVMTDRSRDRHLKAVLRIRTIFDRIRIRLLKSSGSGSGSLPIEIFGQTSSEIFFGRNML
jgi:hypothetical protein